MNDLKCPWCKVPMSDNFLESLELYGDDESQTTVCNECEKEIEITSSVNISLSIKAIKNQKEVILN